MKKIFSRILAVSILLLSSLLIAPSIIKATTFLSDDFSGTVVSSANWYIPTWVSPTDGTYLGRTQLRCSQNSGLPAASSSNAVMTLQTFNPTAPSSAPSFYGAEVISKQSFSVGQGLDIKIKSQFISTTPGVVGGLFMYALKPGQSGTGSLHDEIDFELLSSLPNGVNTNIYNNEPAGSGHSQFVSFPSGGTINTSHTYEIQWLPTQVIWIIDGVVVRTDTSNVPAGLMNVYLNMWAPGAEWSQAYSASLQPTSVSSSNQTFSMNVDSVSVQTIAAAPVLNTISISPASATLNVGDLGQKMTATELDQYGNPISSPITWSSSDTSVATVGATGLVTAVGAGTANITATSGSITSTPSVITVASPLIQIVNVPQYGQMGNATGYVSGISSTNYSKYAVATFIEVAGGWWNKPTFAAPLTAINSDGTWTVNVTTGGNDQNASEIMVFLVPSDFSVPLVSGASSLPASLSAFPSNYTTRSALTSLAIVPAAATLNVGGATQQLSVQALNQDGKIMIIPVTWTSSNPSVAKVDAYGIVTPVSAGTANITISAGGITSAPSVITVISLTPVLTTITLSPAVVSLAAVGATQQLTATKLDQFGKAITATVTWSSSNSAVAKVSTTGLVTAVTPGTVNITATSGSVTSSPSVVTVAKPAPVVKTITLSPLSASLTVGATTQQLVATALDQYGSPIVPTLTWSSSNVAVATVSSSGLVTPVGSGTANIKVSSGTVISAPSVITVIKPAPVLTTITLSPSTVSLSLLGATQQLTATKLDQYGKAIATTIVWASSDSTIAKVSTTGLITAVAPGTVNITATGGAITSMPTVVTVASPSVKIISVPAKGKTGSATGSVAGVATSKYAVAVFIKVAGGWWNKPTFAAPRTAITTTGTWTANVTTGGNDTSATEFMAFLVPSNFVVPLVSGSPSIPSALSGLPYADVTR